MRKFIALNAAVLATLASSNAFAAPYASNVSVSGTTVTFTLNESGSSLAYTVNGGSSVSLGTGLAKGTYSFNLGSASDTFAITASKTDVGYLTPTGATQAATTNGLSQSAPKATFTLVSEDSNVLGRFNSPRGLAVSNNPNASNFGTAYISNTAAGTVAANATNVTAPARTTTGKGVFALRADQSDAFGYGNAGQNPGNLFDATSASSPFRLTVASNGEIYAADFSDATGNIFRLNQNLTSNAQVLAGTGGPTALPVGQNHGSTTAVYPVLGPGGLTLYTLDEDLTTTQTGAGAGTDKNHLWRYDIGTSATPFSAMPTKVNQTTVLTTLASSDLDIGKDGKFYLAQNRSGGGENGIVVLNPDGTVAADSLTYTRAQPGATPSTIDIFRNVLAMDVSDDQSLMAVLLNGSDIALIPLIGGIPQFGLRTIIDTGTDVNSGRDIAFDAVGNLHYVSSGQGIYRILSPGGVQSSTLTWDGSSYSLTSVVPEPATLSTLAIAGAMLRRRRAK